MKGVLSIDPGLSSGFAFGTYSDDEPLVVHYRSQVDGGLLGFCEGLSTIRSIIDWHGVSIEQNLTTVCEKFTPRPHAGGGFTLAQVEPLRIEGYLVGTGWLPDYEKRDPVWRQPAAQYYCGGSTKAERRKRSKAFLRERGLYLTGKDVEAPDAEDAISATLHLLGFLRDVRHRPTLERYFHGDL